MEPPDRLGFPSVNVVINEPSTYQEASVIQEWQLAMSEELTHLIISTLGILFHNHPMP